MRQENKNYEWDSKICLEILDNENVEKSFISILKKKPIFFEIPLKEKKKIINDAFLEALDKNDYNGELISQIFYDSTLEKLISNVSDRLPGIPIIRLDSEGNEILVEVKVKGDNAIKDFAIGCLMIIGAIAGLVLIGDFIFSLIF